MKFYKICISCMASLGDKCNSCLKDQQRRLKIGRDLIRRLKLEEYQERRLQYPSKRWRIS